MVVNISGNIELQDFALIPHAPNALAQGIQQKDDRAGGWDLRVGRRLSHGYGNRPDMYFAGQPFDLVPFRQTA